MFHSIEEFLAGWQYESDITEKLIAGVPESAKLQSINADHRTIERLAWHMCYTLVEMPEKFGLHPQRSYVENEIPATMADIAQAYHELNADFVAYISSLTDADLEKEDMMYGESWRRGKSLQILMLHQAHHRAEVLVLMRQAGLPIIGVYGPTKEQWSQFGMSAPLT